MTKAFSKTMKRLLVWVAMALLIIIFGMTGVPELANFTQSSALKVGKQQFLPADLTQELTRQITALRNRTGESLTQEEAIDRGLGREVIAALTQRALVAADGQNLTIAAPEAEIRRFLNEDPNFHNEATGKFDQLVLENILRGNNISVAEFKSIIGRELKHSQLLAALGSPVAISDLMIDGLLLRESELREVAFIRLSAADLPDLPNPTSEELQAVYDTYLDQFTSQEYRTFDLVLFDQASLSDSVEIPEDELRALYELKKSSYNSPEKRRFRQLLFSSEQEAILALDRLNNGATFGILAQEQGRTLEDITSKDVTSDSLPDRAIAEALFSEAQVSDYLGPVKTLYNYAIAEIISVTPAIERSFEDVREEILREESVELTDRKILDIVDQVELARDEGANLTDSLADIEDVSLVRISSIDQYGLDKSGESSEMAAEILAEVFLLEEGEESLALDLEDGGYFIVSLDQIEDAAPQPFEEVKAEIQALWAAQARQRRLDEKANAIMKEVDDGEDFERVAQAQGQEIAKITLSPSATDIFPRSIIEQIFNGRLHQLIRPASNNPDEILIAMTKAVRFEQRPGLESVEELYKNSFATQIGQELYTAYYQTLERDIGITRNEKQIAAAFNQTQ